MNGWLLLYKKIWSNPRFYKNPTALVIWIWLLTHCDERGVVTCGRQQIANDCGVSESAVYRTLKNFSQIYKENDPISNIRSNNRFSTVCILKWEQLQKKVNSTLNNERTTSEQRANNERTLINNKEERIKNKEKEERKTPGISNENSVVFQIEQKLGITAGDGIYHLAGTSPIDLLTLAEKLGKYISAHPDGKWTEPIIKQTFIKWEAGARKELKRNNFVVGRTYIKPREDT